MRLLFEEDNPMLQPLFVIVFSVIVLLSDGFRLMPHSMLCVTMFLDMVLLYELCRLIPSQLLFVTAFSVMVLFDESSR